MFKMLNSSSRLLALALMVCTPIAARAQILADRVPADTIFYVGWQGVDTNIAGFNGSNLQGVMNDSNLSPLLNDFLPKVFDSMSDRDRDTARAIGFIRNILGPMWRHSTALAFQGIEFDQTAGAQVKLVLLCQAGRESGSLKINLEELVKNAGQTTFPMNVIQRGDLVALVFGYDKPETAIPDAGAPSLANGNAEFSKCLKQVGSGAFQTVYIDVDKTVDIVDTAFRLSTLDNLHSWERTRDVVGFKSVGRVMLTEGFNGKDWESQAFYSAGEHCGLIGDLLDGKPLSPELLKGVSGNSTASAASRFHLAPLIESVRESATGLDPELGKQIAENFAQIDHSAGVDFNHDVLENLGDEWAYYLDPAQLGHGVASVTLINRVKDPVRAQATWARMEEYYRQLVAEEVHDPQKIQMKQAVVDGITVHYLGTPLISESWGIQDGNLIIRLYPDFVTADTALAWYRYKPVQNDPVFEAMLKRLDGVVYSSFSFTDIPRHLPENYPSWDTVLELTAFHDWYGVEAPRKLLPPLKKLLTHVQPAGQFSWTDAEGFHSRGVSPFPGGQLLVTGELVLSILRNRALCADLAALGGRFRNALLKAVGAKDWEELVAEIGAFLGNHFGKDGIGLDEGFGSIDPAAMSSGVKGNVAKDTRGYSSWESTLIACVLAVPVAVGVAAMMRTMPSQTFNFFTPTGVSAAAKAMAGDAARISSSIGGLLRLGSGRSRVPTHKPVNVPRGRTGR